MDPVNLELGMTTFTVRSRSHLLALRIGDIFFEEPSGYKLRSVGSHGASDGV